MLFRFTCYQILYLLIPCLIGALIYRLLWYKPISYTYALTEYIASCKLTSGRWRTYIIMTLRLCALTVLLFLAAKPQLGAQRSKSLIEGIDIILVIDGSGSMMLFDDQYDRRSRLEIAKQEALRFINQRPDDAIGLVIFGNGVLSACPLTHDRAALREIIGQLHIGSMVDDRCTLLSIGMLAALNRLRASQSSKVMIVLTDGQPSPHDLSIHEPLAVARHLNVRIYTVGIGNEDGGFALGPAGMLLREGVQLNDTLLQHIAQQTGGRYFRAKNAQQMRAVYDEIDHLEKRPMPINVYTNYQDAYTWLVWVALLLVALELILRALAWRVLA